MAHNLRSVTLANGTQVEYVVDGRGRRASKKVNGSLTRRWLYSNALKPVAELDGSGALVSRFIYVSRGMVPDLMVRYAGGASTTYRIISDHLGSPRLVVNVATGAVAQQMDHDEFGTVLTDTNPGFQPFGYAGGLYDPDTKLVSFGARDYDPETGRWTRKDPVLWKGRQANLYVYVGNDPVNRRDPRGLDDIFVGLEFDLVGISGFEGQVGVVIDTDHPEESGLFIQGGPAFGANVGASLCVGYSTGDIEGWGSDLDLNLVKGSPVFLFDDKGEWNGVAIGGGPGVGVSVGETKTGTLTVSEMVDWLTKP
jgi:RHS repeat-associated protein